MTEQPCNASHWYALGHGHRQRLMRRHQSVVSGTSGRASADGRAAQRAAGGARGDSPLPDGRAGPGRGAEVRGGEVRGAEVRGAEVRGAEVKGAEVRGAEVRGAEVRGAEVRRLTVRLFGGVVTFGCRHEKPGSASSDSALLH